MTELVLIRVTGADKPGLTSGISAILAQYDVTILDIGQAEIHDTLSLGILAAIPSRAESAPVLKDVLFKAHEMGLSIRFTPVTPESYEQWVQGQGKPRHIITLLSRQIEAEAISRVTAIVAEHGLNIDQINRLSGRVSLANASENPNTRACVEFSVRGDADQTHLRARFLEVANELGVDIAFQEDNVYRRTRRLVCFDMDSTLIEAEVIDELAAAAGVGEQVAEITERAMQGELDFIQSFEQRVALLKGLKGDVLQGIAERLPVTEGAERLIRNLSALGYKTAILSGGFNYFGRYLQEKLGIDYVFANELEMEDGVVTGRVTGRVVDGQRKAELLRELAEKEEIRLEQTIAVGDGANDLPMLSIAGLGIAFRAKPLVRENAKNAISTLGLDGILYLLGYSDRDIAG
ncbi:MAG: phosphoserine phosphatase SerB [Oceanospirillaceae bacterium]|uniref:phosphoserine phosphatase SerB n=1 Tax=unclassified Thalassolituus TaxID=2624967 RepID=UPI000C0B7651|nr:MULTISPECIES: phosphoserine phosphatase SerB [unclassified Thalassolituus]MAK92565.1 phosphoserine phosphatase SerB [Thalassolituus sp.]MBS51773.1 phosphoserine phosphatase SerB [Oceanospirillaceae bacterium]